MFETLKAVTDGQYCPPRVLVPELPHRMEAAIQGALKVPEDERIPDCETLLKVWTGEEQNAAPSTPSTPATPWSRELLDDIRRAQPSSDAATATLDISGDPAATSLETRPTPDQPEAYTSPPATPASRSATGPSGVSTRPPWWVFPAGVLAGVPALAGVMMLYGDFFEVMARGGPFMGLVVLMGALGIGLVSWLAMAEDRGRTYVGGWLLFPALTIFAGTLGTCVGIEMMNRVVEAVELEVKAKLLNMGLSVALTTEYSGMAMGAELLLAAALLIVWTQRHHLAIAMPGRRASVAAGLAAGGGLLLWILQAFAFWRAGHGNAPAPFLVYLTLVSTSLCSVALLNGKGRVGLRPRVLTGIVSVLGVAAASRGGELQKQLNLLDELATQEPADLLEAAGRFVSYLETVSVGFPVGWTLLAAVVAMVALADLRHELRWPRPRVLALPILLAVLVASVQAVALNSKRSVIDRVLPAYLGSASSWYFGFALEDFVADAEQPWTHDGLRAPQPGEDRPIGADDIIIAVEDLPVASVADLLQRLRACACDAPDVSCSLASTCLGPGSEIELTLLRAPEANAPDARLERITVSLVAEESSD